METIISILTRFVADAVLCCAAVAAFSLGCAVVWKWQNLAEGLKGEPKIFRAVFVAMLVAAAGDPDEDGLSNWMEYALGTLPFDRYSFDDAVDDLEWNDWGYGMPLSDYGWGQVG